MTEQAVSSDSDSSAHDPRERILSAACRVISRRGADHTRYVDIAREAGVSVGSIQHYFDGRAELLAAAFHAFNNKTNAAAKAIYETEPNPVNRLVALVRFCVEGPKGWDFHDTWSVWLEYWSSSNRDAELRSTGGSLYDLWRQPFHDAIEDGAEDGLFELAHPIPDTVDRIIGSIEGLSLRALLEPDRMPLQRMFDMLIDVVRLELGVSIPVGPAVGRMSAPPVHS
jgi:AcrR family transcriptional regulator